MDSVASVVRIGAIRPFATMRPLTAPQAAPSASTTRSHRNGPAPAPVTRVAVTATQRLTMPPTDRSMPPVSTTRLWPIATNTSGRVVLRMDR